MYLRRQPNASAPPVSRARSGTELLLDRIHFPQIPVRKLV